MRYIHRPFRLLVSLVLLAGSATVRAACVDYTVPLHWAAGVPAADVRDVAAAGDLVAAALGDDGLLLVDLADPAAPVVRGGLALPTTAVAVALAGDHAYVAARYAGLLVLDVGDPAAPVLAGQLDTPGDAQAVALAGGHALVADGTAGLAVVDVTQPASPVLCGEVAVGAEARDVAVDGTLAWVAAGAAGLVAVDWSAPDAPVVVEATSLPGPCDRVAARDGLVAAGWTGGDGPHVSLLVPATRGGTTTVATVDVPEEVRELIFNGTLLLVADTGGDLRLVETADPATPVLLPVPDTVPGVASGVAAGDDWICLAGTTAGVQVLTGAAGEAVGVTPLAAGGPDVAVAVLETADAVTACVAGDGPWLWTYDVTTGERRDTVVLPGAARDVAIAGGLALVAASTADLAVVDPGTAGGRDAALLATLSLPGFAEGVAGWDTLGCVVSETAGLHTVSLADPAAPAHLGTVALPGAPRRVVLDGTRAWVAAGEAGVLLVDVSDPSAPWYRAALATPGPARDLAVDGDRLYVAAGSGGLLVVDISSPGAPVLLASVPLPGDARDVAVRGTTVYVGCGDLSSSYPDHGVVVACDVTDPAAPVLLGGAETGGEVRGLAAWSDGLVAATSRTTPLAVPLACPANVAIEPGDPGTDPAQGPPARTALVAVAPNPFNPRTTVVFACRRPGPAVVTVHDLAGRRLAVLLRRAVTAGEHRVTWDGRDAAGRALPAGTYVVRLVTPDGVDARKVALVR